MKTYTSRKQPGKLYRRLEPDESVCLTDYMNSVDNPDNCGWIRSTFSDRLVKDHSGLFFYREIEKEQISSTDNQQTEPDRAASRERIAQVHPADRFSAMFGEQVEPRPTPETDAAARRGAYQKDPALYPETSGKQLVHIDDARRLERERDEALELLAKALARGDDALEEAHIAKRDLSWSDMQDKRELVRERDAALELLASEKSTRNDIIAKGVELEKEIAEMREAIKEAYDTFVNLAEYWNKDQNEMAMADACWHTAEASSAALAKLQPFIHP